MNKQIEIKNLSFIHDPRKTDGIKDLSLTINKGSVFSLVGPSGSGKSTTLKCICNKLTPMSGEINFPEQENIRYLDQNINLSGENTVLSYLAERLKKDIPNEDQRINQIRTVIAELNLTNEIESSLQSLSGGQAQRVALAEVLCYNPTILLLDEPFANLDPDLRKQIYSDLFHLLDDKEITLVMVSHSLDEAMAYSDKIGILNFGELQEVGSPRDLYFKPTKMFTAQFLSQSNIITGKIIEIGSEGIKIDCINHVIKTHLTNLIEGDYVLIHCPREAISILEGKNGDYKGEILESHFYGSHTEFELTSPIGNIKSLMPSYIKTASSKVTFNINHTLLQIIEKA